MQGVIIFAHGSRDPVWHLPVEAVAREVGRQAPDALVGCAYLELSTPDLHSCTSDMVARGATSIRVLPLFFGMGKHAREDLPQLIEEASRRHPSVHIECLPAAGEHSALTQLLASIAIGALS